MDDILDTTPDITPQLVASYLSTAEFPIDLDNVIRVARLQRAPQPIIDVLFTLEPGIYNSLEQLEFYLQKVLQ